ncbi:hypothetical protein DFJ77DRAFT_431010 [Powellomyces hirtus]|nr:hypothetical protein DFJ77DRAFT_431010 [Powellomyces hirtus]
MARTKNGLRINGFEPTTFAKTVESQTRIAIAEKQPCILPTHRRIICHTPKLKATCRKRKQTAWLREIKQYQKLTKLLICKLPFQYPVCNIASDLTRTSIQWQSSALLAPQETTKVYLVAIFFKWGPVCCRVVHSSQDCKRCA